MKNSRRFYLSIFCLLLVAFSFSVPVFASSFYSPQDLQGLQTANIYYSTEASTILREPTLSQDMVFSVPGNTSGIDLADVILFGNVGSDTYATLYFYWTGNYKADFNEIVIQNVPNDFRVTVSAQGYAAMDPTQLISTSLDYVGQRNGWSLYNNYAFSATQTPMLSQVISLQITIDGGSAQLSTLADNDIILSLSVYPYYMGLLDDAQYSQGYADAQEVYSANLQQQKQAAYDRGFSSGRADALTEAQDVLLPAEYLRGKEDGIIIGRNQALEDPGYDLKDLIFAIPQAHVTVLEGFLNWNLLGFNLFDVFQGIVVALLIAVFLRVACKIIF